MNKYETMNETNKHIKQVREFINDIIKELIDRAQNHDYSKLENPEVDIFTEYTPKLKECTYGSDEYNKYLKEMKVALNHHYSENRHHPEYFENGIDDMNLIDLIEMICDWKSASMRHSDGDIMKSIDINSKRFKMSNQLVKILKNTVKNI